MYIEPLAPNLSEGDMFIVMRLVTSPNNPTVKLMKSLHKKKYRDEEGLYFVEGIKMVREAIIGGYSIHTVIYSKDYDIKKLDFADKLGNARQIFVDGCIFREISDVRTPQGIIAIIKKKQRDMNMITEKGQGFWVALDRVQDPGNLGTIIRTVDAVGGSGVVLLKGCVDPYNPKSVRATMGSILRVPIIQVENNRDFFSWMMDNNVDIFASAMEGQNIFSWEDYRPGGIKVLVIGNESQGISQEVHDHATCIVSIPIIGGAESLNASVAAGIMIYEIMRKEGNLGREFSCIS